MPEVVVSLDEETAEQLDVERELLGFDSRAEYLTWIVTNRAAIDKGTERERLLSAYKDRIAALERRLDEIEATKTGPETAGEAVGPDVASAQAGTDGSTTASALTPETTDPSPATDAENDSKESTAEEASGTDVSSDTDESGATEPAPTVDAATKPSADEQPDETGLAGVDRIEASTSIPGPDGEPSDAAADAGVESMHLAPERVSRVSEDTVGEDADVLSGVETDRLDELTRRAVAKTRKELDRNVETGLTYRSSTSLADESVRPGDDIADLDTLDLPGRSEDTLNQRRAAAGHALAFLRDSGRARRAEFVDALYEEHPAGYGTEDGWWGCIKQALKQVDAVDGGPGTRVWTFDG